MKRKQKRVKRISKTAHRQEVYILMSDGPNTSTVTKYSQNLTFTIQGNQSKFRNFLNSAKGAIKWLIY